jgi:aminoglycoside phosphotransferase family enzyme
MLTTSLPPTSGSATVAVTEANEPALASKVAFLSRPQAYCDHPPDVIGRETHMSWVFLAGERAYKLKKPVRFPYLDFSTLEKRESACRAELRLNRRLAKNVYLGVVPLCASGSTLSIDGEGAPIDWLVVMRRLDERRMLDRLLARGEIQTRQLDRVAAMLVEFYRRAARAFVPTAVNLCEWRRSLDYNRRVLLNPRLRLAAGSVVAIDRVQRRFLTLRGRLLAGRVRARRLVDGHGDLRPEHIWLGPEPAIIDCLEFNARLRTVDPFDELAFLDLECERLGAAWVGRYLRRRVGRALRDGPSSELFTFYRCHRAMLRARLAIAHLLEPRPRTAEKWPRLARAYLRLAAADAARLERYLRRPTTRRTKPVGVHAPDYLRRQRCDRQRVGHVVAVPVRHPRGLLLFDVGQMSSRSGR